MLESFGIELVGVFRYMDQSSTDLDSQRNRHEFWIIFWLKSLLFHKLALRLVSRRVHTPLNNLADWTIPSFSTWTFVHRDWQHKQTVEKAIKRHRALNYFASRFNHEIDIKADEREMFIMKARK